MDDETRLYLETDSYMQRCCEIELKDGKDALYYKQNNHLTKISYASSNT